VAELDDDSYVVVIAPTDEDETDAPLLYDSGTTLPLSKLVEEPPTLPTGEGVAPDTSLADYPDAAIAAFAEECLVDDEEGIVTTTDVYDAYTDRAEERDLPTESKNWFAGRLSDQVTFDRTAVNRDGKTDRCYEGISLREELTDQDR